MTKQKLPFMLTILKNVLLVVITDCTGTILTGTQ